MITNDRKDDDDVQIDFRGRPGNRFLVFLDGFDDLASCRSGRHSGSDWLLAAKPFGSISIQLVDSRADSIAVAALTRIDDELGVVATALSTTCEPCVGREFENVSAASPKHSI